MPEYYHCHLKELKRLITVILETDYYILGECWILQNQPFIFCKKCIFVQETPNAFKPGFRTHASDCEFSRKKLPKHFTKITALLHQKEKDDFY